MIKKCLNCRKKDQESWSNFCSLKCKAEYIKIDEEIEEGKDVTEK